MGHKRDAKAFFVVSGRLVVRVDGQADWKHPPRDLPVRSFVLDAERTAVLKVPPRHFTAIIAAVERSALPVFSMGSIESAKDDDWRLPAEWWRGDGPKS